MKILIPFVRDCAPFIGRKDYFTVKSELATLFKPQICGDGLRRWWELPQEAEGFWLELSDKPRADSRLVYLTVFGNAMFDVADNDDSDYTLQALRDYLRDEHDVRAGVPYHVRVLVK